MASFAVKKAPTYRRGIGALLGVGILINYIDRVGLTVAAPQLKDVFHLSPVELGLLFSAFSWSYAALQIPTGMVLDRFGVTRVGRWSAFLWGIAATLTALSSGFAGIIVGRVLLGVAEAPAFPVSSKATGYWFPRSERGLATAIFDAAAKFSNVIGVPLIAFTVVRFGWRWGFAMTAALSFIYFFLFLIFYRDPSQHPYLSKEELAHIRDGGATPEGASQAGAIGMLRYLLGKAKVWGLTIGFAAYGFSFYLFLTWLPSYLVSTMNMSIIQSAGYAAIPWSVATATDLFVGGWLIDHLIEIGGDDSRVRKGVLIVGMLFGLAVFGATQTADPRWAILWISISLGGLAHCGRINQPPVSVPTSS